MDDSIILTKHNSQYEQDTLAQNKSLINNWRVGDKACFSKTISETDVYLFAGITGDFNPVHVNQIIAENSFACTRIVHGALISGMVSTVIGMKLPGSGTIYMEQDSKFLRPVCIGDTIVATVVVEEVINNAKRVIKLRTYVKNQRDELVLDGYAIVKAPASEQKGEMQI